MNLRALTRRLRSEEHGVVLVLVAMLMTVFIASAALAIDVGSFYHAQSQAQQAADAGALAGADVLASAPATASTVASNMATSNDSNVTPTVTLPPTTPANQVKVVVTGTAPAFFGQFLGLSKANISATAVATAGTVASAPISIYANSQAACSTAFHFDGSNDTFGSIQTNGTGFFNGGTDAFGAFLYGHGCSAPIYNGSSASTDTFTSGPSPAPATQTFPKPFTTADFTCDTTLSGNQNFSGTVSGTYCDFGGVISFSGAVNGNATFIADQFNANSITGNITPAQNGVTLYQIGASDLHVQAAGYFNGGIIYAPLAAVTIQNFSGTISGIVEADSVTVSASSLIWNGITTTSSGGLSELSQ